MSKNRIMNYAAICCVVVIGSCVPSLIRKSENKSVPSTFGATTTTDTTNEAYTPWRTYFKDPDLIALIDTALKNNQEFNIVMQEINIAKQEVRARKGQYLPFVDLGIGAGVEKAGRYTRSGAVDANMDIAPGKEFPEPLPDFKLGANVSWELDIWKKLRNSKKSAVLRFLSTQEGLKFMQTNLIAEISVTYYELMALDNRMEILKRNIEIQQNALEIVKLEKSAARVTELAVRRFEAEVLKNQSRQYYIAQQIIEAENRINFLVGRFPQPVQRNSKGFYQLKPDSIQAGIPAQLLENRPDVKQAELDLEANKLDVKIAKANFYPTLRIEGGIGYQAFNPGYLLNPESVVYNAAGELVAPLINRNAIKADYYAANARQIQAVYNYERSILRAHIEVSNQISNLHNLEKSYALKDKQVQALMQSIDISTGLFRSARADYMEILLTQRDALEARFELIEIKQQEMHAMVNIYQALGGGWR